MVRQWRHVKALKRAGRGHETMGVKGTQAGDLTVRCPACPCIGYNLPENWDTVSEDLRYVTEGCSTAAELTIGL